MSKVPCGISGENFAKKYHHISNIYIYIITSKPWPRTQSGAQPGDLSGAAREPIPRLGRFFFWFPVSHLHGLVMMVSYSSKNQDVFLFSFEMTCEASHRVVYHPGN